MIEDLRRFRVSIARLSMSVDSTVGNRVLVTGATGYIGTRLVARLVSDGWEVHAVIRQGTKSLAATCLTSSVRLHEHDGSAGGMIDIVAGCRPGIVYHLASLFLSQHEADDVARLINSNVVFGAQLAEAVVAAKVPFFINTGTSWQHFKDAEYLPVNLYAATKQAFEDILAYYIDAHGLKVATLLLFDTYGPEDPRPKLIPLLCRAAETNQRLQMSPGEQLIDLVHVDDVVDAFLAAAASLPTQSQGHVHYGVSSGSPVPLVELVAAFERAVGKSLHVTWGGRPYRPREVMRPWGRFDLVPNWRPRVSFEVGIRQLWRSVDMED